MVVNFSTLPVLAGIGEITRSNATTPAKVAAFAMVYRIVLPPVLAPVVSTSVLGRRHVGGLDATHRWVGRNARTVGTVIEAASAADLLAKGVRDLP